MMKLVYTVLAVLLCAVTSTHAEPQGQKIAFLITSPTHSFIVSLTKSFVEKASSSGMEVTTFSTSFDVALQSQQVDDAIVCKFDMIALKAAAE